MTVAAEALERIAQDLQDQARRLSISQLQHVITMLNKVLKDLQGQAPPGVRRAVQTLEAIHRVKQGDPINRVLQWLARHPWVAGIAIYVVLCSVLVVWHAVATTVVAPEDQRVCQTPTRMLPCQPRLGGIKVPVSLVLLVGFFHYHPRVLDAWVAAHLGAVHERFLPGKTPSVTGGCISPSLPSLMDTRCRRSPAETCSQPLAGDSAACSSGGRAVQGRRAWRARWPDGPWQKSQTSSPATIA